MKKTREIPIFLIESFHENGAIDIKDKDAMHTCIVDFIENYVKNDGNIESDIICYLIDADEEEVKNGMYSMVDFDQHEEDLLDSEINTIDVSLMDAEDEDAWADDEINIHYDQQNGTLTLETENQNPDTSILADFFSWFDIAVFEIKISNEDYLDPLDKALEYFESIEDYEMCARINQIRKDLILKIKKN